MWPLVGPGFSGRAGTSLPVHGPHSQAGPDPAPRDPVALRGYLPVDVATVDEIAERARDLEHLHDGFARVDDAQIAIVLADREEGPERAGVEERHAAQVDLRQLAIEAGEPRLQCLAVQEVQCAAHRWPTV